jgi:hypothetical protein
MVLGILIWGLGYLSLNALQLRHLCKCGAWAAEDKEPCVPLRGLGTLKVYRNWSFGIYQYILAYTCIYWYIPNDQFQERYILANTYFIMYSIY